jgi:hypothetical protein
MTPVLLPLVWGAKERIGLFKRRFYMEAVPYAQRQPRAAQKGDSDASILYQIKSLRKKAPLEKATRINDLIATYQQRHPQTLYQEILAMTNNAYLVNLED